MFFALFMKNHSSEPLINFVTGVRTDKHLLSLSLDVLLWMDDFLS